MEGNDSLLKDTGYLAQVPERTAFSPSCHDHFNFSCFLLCLSQ